MAKQRPIKTIGRVEKVTFPEKALFGIPSRIDTGAKTSAIWASEIALEDTGKLSYYLFDKHSKYFNGRRIYTKAYTLTVVSSSMGSVEKRYKVKLLLKIKGRRIRGSFTLADRSQQVYPVLIGRNVLRGKFIVDVKKGKVLYDAEKARTAKLRSNLKLKDKVE